MTCFFKNNIEEKKRTELGESVLGKQLKEKKGPNVFAVLFFSLSLCEVGVYGACHWNNLYSANLSNISMTAKSIFINPLGTFR